MRDRLNSSSPPKLQPASPPRPRDPRVPFGSHNLTGQRFGRLTVVRFAGLNDYDTLFKRRATWWCICDCGGAPKAPVRAENLIHGQVRSCGCLRRRAVRDAVADGAAR
jgi:hypothetical protein